MGKLLHTRNEPNKMTRLAMYQNFLFPQSFFSPQNCKYPLIYKAPVSIEKNLSLSFTSKTKIKAKRAAGSFSKNVAYALKSIWALLRKNSIWKSSFRKGEEKMFFCCFLVYSGRKYKLEGLLFKARVVIFAGERFKPNMARFVRF